MRQFRLTFKPNTTILERRLNNGTYFVTEIYPERVDKDAKLLDQLLSDLSGSPKTNYAAFLLD